MCLRPIKIYNPTKRISLDYSQRFEIEVPCGECAECRETKKSEWYFRTYYQWRETIDKGGYVLFDTLTYDNKNLPHISDIWNKMDRNSLLNYPCFNPEDYRLFFVRLRRALDYRGFDVKDNLKYFLCSEYGSDDTKTHRPHYHILIFITDPTLDPLVLSKLVNTCWSKGRTDGVDYNGAEYVLKKRVFGKGYNMDFKHSQAVCNYVAKYVLKDSKFQKVIDNRIRSVFDRIYEYGWSNDKNKEDEFKKVVRSVSQFHRQSKGFGEYALNMTEKEINDMFDTGMMSMPTSDLKIVKHIPIPKYYQMKIFYEQFRDSHGQLRWRLSDLGMRWKLERAQKLVDLGVKRMENWYKNIDLRYVTPNDELIEGGHLTQEECMIRTQELKDKINKYLDGRSWKDFIIYKMFYKGRIRSNYARNNHIRDDIRMMLYNGLINREFDFDCKDNQELGDTTYEFFWNYNSKKFRRDHGCSIITNYNMFIEMPNGYNGDKDCKGLVMPFVAYSGYDKDSDSMNSEGYLYEALLKRGKFSMTPNSFKLLYCYDENSDPIFHDFDKLISVYEESNYYYNIRKQNTYDEKERLKDVHKTFFGTNKNI